jgi:hypothetical protein
MTPSLPVGLANVTSGTGLTPKRHKDSMIRFAVARSTLVSAR